ncbi:uncharacterized protein LOC124926565 [Impatiens glandulifera]|uniref:uncharacterized protein LOC124926565 n=1 Tax=Impatiens glandulifera TaxID=253017 RepID=UPI001FB117B9|nr:uncharacterized protein LOC124926565 [Impatiens glandulifera]
MENVRDLEFANGKDGDGNNVLHQAVKYKQIEIINYILVQNMVDINATNAMGLTPLDILLKQSYHMNVKDLDIKETLKHAGAMKAKEILFDMATNDAYASEFHDTSSSKFNRVSNSESAKNNYNNIFGSKDWLPRRRDSLMVVASLIATMAFTAGLNPPGGVWQENTIKLNDIPHRAGEAIIAYNYSDSYKFYLRSNTIAYVASLSIILLLISGLPFRRRRYMWTLQVVMWVTITAMAFTYAYALVALTPKKDRRSLKRTLVAAVLVWCIVMALVFIGNALRLFMKWLTKGKKGMDCWKGRRNQNDMPQI